MIKKSVFNKALKQLQKEDVCFSEDAQKLLYEVLCQETTKLTNKFLANLKNRINMTTERKQVITEDVLEVYEWIYGTPFKP